MKKISLTTIMLLLFVMTAKSQSYIGFLTDNYSGVHGVISNPANIADSRFRADVNLFGASGLLGNDYISFTSEELFNEGADVDFEATARRTPSDDNNFFANADILGPSFMFNIDDKSSVALFTRGRFFTSATDINGQLYENFSEDFDDEDFVINEGNFNASANAYMEIGATYAREVFTKGDHYVKGGVSLKYLRGIANTYTSGKNVSLDFNADGITPTNGSLTTTGEISYGESDIEELDEEFQLSSGAVGFGADIGFVYEYRPDFTGDPYQAKDENKYKFKVGVSVTDIGSLKYKQAQQESYNITGVVSEDDFNSEGGDLNDVLNRFYTQTGTDAFTKSVLPTALHVNADYNINNTWYVNLNTDLSLISKTTVNASRAASMVSLTPRYERKWFSFYAPLSYMEHSGFQAGFGLRAGPLYVGSGSIVSLLISDKSQAGDAYLGLKVPIFQSKPKDNDGDGVIDRLDDCKDIAGPAENNGCPYQDTDGDKVIDKDDKCPEEAGEVLNNGCPFPDTDGDTVIDKEDVCPEEAGPVKNQGCPFKDTDGDTVIDKEDVCPKVVGPASNQGCPLEPDTDGDTVVDSKDLCPTVPGIVANNGCPEVSTEVQDELNSYAKTILFNSGKSTIKSESFTVLGDIIDILKKYPSSRFIVEGHTDNVGSDTLNQKLSQDRASRVKDYLIQNGVPSASLRSSGFGEIYPIASNDNAEGRKANRRVEINLLND